MLKAYGYRIGKLTYALVTTSKRKAQEFASQHSDYEPLGELEEYDDTNVEYQHFIPINLDEEAL
jgi:hypothetical protein